MAFPVVPDWLRIILLIMSLLSFIPQLHHTVSRRNSSGISVYYVLFNLISATEQFALVFFFVVNYIDDPDMFVQKPVNTGDWLNLAQTAAVLLLWLVLFVLCLLLPSDHRDAPTWFAVGTYVAFLSISLVPLYLDIINPSYPNDRRWFGAIYSGIHTLFLNWIVTGLGATALLFQVRETLLRLPSEALSHVGLAVQAAVFALVAVSWVMRVQFPWELLDGHKITFGVLITWYEIVGWAAVDNAIFALVQIVLLWIVSHRSSQRIRAAGDESEPLLRAYITWSRVAISSNSPVLTRITNARGGF